MKGPSEILLKPRDRERVMSGPVVIPSAVNMQGTKKTSKNTIRKEPTAVPTPDSIEAPSEYQAARERNSTKCKQH